MPVTPNWTAIEAAYRAGIEPLRVIGEANSISEGAIRKRARRDGWTRDLGARIQARAESLVRKQEVRKPGTLIDERTEIDANAQVQAAVMIGQRKDVTRLRGIVNDLMGELCHQTGYQELYVRLGELMASPDDKDRLNEIYRKVIALPSRIDSAKKLVDAFDRLVDRERQVFGIDRDTGNDDRERITQIVLVAVRPEIGRVIDG